MLQASSVIIAYKQKHDNLQKCKTFAKIFDIYKEREYYLEMQTICNFAKIKNVEDLYEEE